MFGPNNTPSADLRLDQPPEPEPTAGWRQSVGTKNQSVQGCLGLNFFGRNLLSTLSFSRLPPVLPPAQTRVEQLWQ